MGRELEVICKTRQIYYKYHQNMNEHNDGLKFDAGYIQFKNQSNRFYDEKIILITQFSSLKHMQRLHNI